MGTKPEREKLIEQMVGTWDRRETCTWDRIVVSPNGGWKLRWVDGHWSHGGYDTAGCGGRWFRWLVGLTQIGDLTKEAA